MSNEINWTLLWEGQNKVFNTRCLKFSRKCLGKNEITYEIKLNKTHSKSLELKAEAQCIFPFKYNGKNYSTCTMDGSEKLVNECVAKSPTNLFTFADMSHRP